MLHTRLLGLTNDVDWYRSPGGSLNEASNTALVYSAAL